MRIMLATRSNAGDTSGELTRETFDERCRPAH
jgi:hypothetical protein